MCEFNIYLSFPEIDGRLRVIHGVGEDGGPSRLENLYGNQMDEETEKVSLNI